MNNHLKVGATTIGAAATLFLANITFGGDGVVSAASQQPEPPATGELPSRAVSGAGYAIPSGSSRATQTSDWIRASELASGGSGSADSETTTNDGIPDGPPNPADDSDRRTRVSVPRRITVVLPNYEAGSPPRVSPPSYAPGTPPSVEHEGRVIVIDLGESGSMTPPEYQPGEPGTFSPPDVVVE